MAAVICIYTTLSPSADSAGLVFHFRKMILRDLVPYYGSSLERNKKTHTTLRGFHSAGTSKCLKERLKWPCATPNSLYGEQTQDTLFINSTLLGLSKLGETESRGWTLINQGINQSLK